MKYNTWKVQIVASLIFCSLVLLLPLEALALPAYERLFRKKYKYPVSCYLCHSQGGGSAIGYYGKDFKRRGMSFLSFGKLEDLDSDKDGFKNIAEILAKSNPGDKKSTPEKPGDWLERMEESFIPRAQLIKVYPEATFFTVLEGSLNQKQIQAIESSLGRKLSDVESVPTFYFAFTGKKEKPNRIGLAMFETPPGKSGSMSIGVGIALNGSIHKLVIYKSKEDQKIFQGSFLSQFEGKTLKNAFSVDQDIESVPGEEELSKRFSESVKLALLTMYKVFSKR